jgi:hypothetical protein
MMLVLRRMWQWQVVEHAETERGGREEFQDANKNKNDTDEEHISPEDPAPAVRRWCCWSAGTWGGEVLLTADEKIIRVQDGTKREEAAEDRKDIVQGNSHSPHCCGWFLVGVLCQMVCYY